MATRAWTPQLDGKTHTVELEHGYWSNKRVIRVPVTLPTLPKWTWAFIALCLLIPILGFMTRATVLLGGLTAALCALIEYDVHKPSVLRVALCLGVTLVAWVGFVSDFS